MGACFQAPHATPGQRPMETLLCLTFVHFIIILIGTCLFIHTKLPAHWQNVLVILCGWAAWSPLQHLPRSRREKGENKVIIVTIK